MHRGPLLFCLLLSFFLSLGKEDQASVVFSGVFAIVWIGEAVVTLQIKLLGGNMFVVLSDVADTILMLTREQIILPVGVHHWLHALSARYSCDHERFPPPLNTQDTGLHRLGLMVVGSWSKHPGRVWRSNESSGACAIPIICVLCWTWMLVLHYLVDSANGVIIGRSWHCFVDMLPIQSRSFSKCCAVFRSSQRVNICTP